MATKQKAKGLRKEWDSFIQSEIGQGVRLPGVSPKKKFTTRQALTSAGKKENGRKRVVKGSREEVEYIHRCRVEKLELTNAWDAMSSSSSVGGDDENDDTYEVRSVDSTNSKKDAADSNNNSNKKRKKLAVQSQSQNNKKNKGGKNKAVSLYKLLVQDPTSKAFQQATAKPSRYPPRKVCVITGKFARYTDPSTLLPFYDKKAQAQLLEQPPGWTKTSSYSSTPFFDALKTIEQEL